MKMSQRFWKYIKMCEKNIENMNKVYYIQATKTIEREGAKWFR